MPFVHLHAHSEFSAFDGLSTPAEMVEAAVADGQNACAITDHGVCAGHPAFQLACDKGGIKPIFGMEAYFVDDVSVRENQYDYWHLILWAMDDDGLRNLWALSTESYRTGEYGKPRIDWAMLERFNEGIMASTACLGGPLADPYLKGDEDRALANLARLKDIFGDRLYIEIQTNHLPDQLKVNRWLEKISVRYDVPPIAASDSHYPTPGHKHVHKVWMSAATNKDVADDNTELFEGDHDYHLMTGDEVLESLAYLSEDFVIEAFLNTQKVADRCTAKIEKRSHVPVYSKPTSKHPDPVEHDRERLLDLCLERWEERTRGKPYSQAEAIERFEVEFPMIADKRFPGYFLMVADIVNYAKKSRVFVGPSRGSGGGSFVAYLIGITEMDPIEHNILFARFMTKGRTELPDFDIDFPSSKKQMMIDYVSERWGAEHVAIVSTHQRLKSKSAIQAVARAIKSRLPEDHWTDVMALSDIITAAEGDTAGLGLDWDELWARAGEELEPYAERYPELFELVGQVHGRLRTYGKHPAGLIIDPDASLVSSLPLRSGEEGSAMVTQFDLAVLDQLGYVKFDLLNLTNLDTLQLTIDLIYEHTGRQIDPYSWREELADPFIYEQITDGWTLGLFQVGTNLGTAMCRQFKPETLRDMADILTLVRPGPRNAKLDKQYLRRRFGEEEISYPDERLAEILAGTEGVLIYQEQLMAICMKLAGYDDVRADKVRKILGKKKVKEAAEEGEHFIAQAIEHGTEPNLARELWAQMFEFARYSFGLGHAIGYAIVCLWTAWFKFHYPLYFLCAALSTVKDEAIPTYVEEARRLGYQVLPPDVNQSGRGFALDKSGLAVRYGLDAIKGIGDAARDAITQAQPYESWEDFLARKGEKCNAGHIKTLTRIGAFDSLVPHRRWLEEIQQIEAIASSGRCQHKVSEEREIVWLPTPAKGQPAEPEPVDWQLPCTFDWTQEPSEIGRTGKPKKRKAPPKKCTKACRQFVLKPLPEPDSVDVYTDEEVRDIEVEFLGVYLSSTPFERIAQEDRERFATATEVLSGPHGVYAIAAVIKAFRTAKKRNDMGFLTLVTERGELDCVVFPSSYEKYRSFFRRGVLVFASVIKNERGQSLNYFMPVD